MPWIPADDPDIAPRKFLIDSHDKMKRKHWRKDGKPNWWVRIGAGKIFKWVPIEPIPGYKKLKVILDLEEHYIPPGESIYFGVGSADVGVRDQYDFASIDPDHLEWWTKPEHIEWQETGTICNRWWTKDRRYCIGRIEPAKLPDGGEYEPRFTVMYGK